MLEFLGNSLLSSAVLIFFIAAVLIFFVAMVAIVTLRKKIPFLQRLLQRLELPRLGLPTASSRLLIVLRRCSGVCMIGGGVFFFFFFLKFLPFLLDAFYEFLVFYPEYSSLISVLGTLTFLGGFFLGVALVVEGADALKRKEA